MSDWKPGDVAMVRFGGGDIEPAILTNTGRWYSLLDGCWDSGGMEPIRPLVVIDPESAEDVKRLRKLLFPRGASCVADVRLDSDVAAALREFANPTPPKPAEPTGLGAVVIDAGGDAWVHDREANPGYLGVEWLNVRTQAHRHYRSIDVVRVLSEGVTP